MPSTYTPLLRLELQNPGESLNTWGSKLNNDTTAMVDQAVAGVTTITPSGPITLSTANGATDQARAAIINATSGTGGTITIPAVSHVYQVRNNCSGNLVFTSGSGTTATVEPGSLATVFCDGTNCYRFADAADIAACLVTSKAYTDAAAFASASGNLPGQGGNAGKFLGTNGTNPSWVSITSGNVTGALGFTPQTALGFTPLNAASNLSDVPSPSAALSTLGGVSSTFLSGNYSTTTVANAYLTANYAPLVSPALTGAPTVPTASPGTNTTQAASTAFVGAAVAAGAYTIPYAQFQESRASGTASSTAFSATTWSQRVLNTTLKNTIAGASLASNQITLPAGTYSLTFMGGSNVAVSNGTYRSRIRDITDSVTINSGPAVFISAGTNQPTMAQAVFVLGGTKVLEIDSWVSAGTATGGTPQSTGEPEIYSDIMIMKIA